MQLMVALPNYLNMAAAVSTWTLVMFLCGTSQAFFNNARSTSSFPTPRYDTCRETIEDLKALLEITQSLKPDSTYVCPTCSSSLSEELIIKLVNALIFTATQNCGFSGKGCGGIPGHHGGALGGNTGVTGSGGNNGGGGGVIGGNSGIGTGGGVVNEGGNNNGVGNYGGIYDPRGGGSDYKNGNDNSLLAVNVAGKPLINVGVGSQSGSGDNGAQPAGVLPASGGQSSGESPLIGATLLGGDNELVRANLGKQELLNVRLGSSHSDGGSTGGSTQGTKPNTGTSVPATSGGGGHTSPVTGVVPGGSPGNNSPTSTSTATNQVAGTPGGGNAGPANTVINQPITNVPTNTGGATTPGAGEAAPDNYVNSGNSSTDQNSSTVVNVVNPPKNSTSS